MPSLFLSTKLNAKNISNWDGTIGAVQAATSMTTFEDGASSPHATPNPLIGLFIVLSKLATGTLCAIGAVRMWRAQANDMATFASNKEIALTGCAIAMITLFGSFIVVAESWFELWRPESMREPVLESTFYYAGMIALIGLFVATKDE